MRAGETYTVADPNGSIRNVAIRRSPDEVFPYTVTVSGVGYRPARTIEQADRYAREAVSAIKRGVQEVHFKGAGQ